MKTTISLILFICSILTAQAQFTKLLEFPGGTNGARPGEVLLYNNYLYGVASQGGANNGGVIYKVRPDGTGYEKLHDFDNAIYPGGSLITDGVFLYGTTSSGGTGNLGTVYRVRIDGSGGYLRLLSFTGINGDLPMGSLYYDGNYLYGVTNKGGTDDKGVIYKVRNDGTAYAKLLDFTGFLNGSRPRVGFIFDGTFLYGTTSWGGSYDVGTVFKIKRDGTGFAKLLDFDGTNGNGPSGKLTTDGTYLYGITYSGGQWGLGTLFKIKTDGFGFVKLLDFGIVSDAAANPSGGLALHNGFLYGATAYGGDDNMGVLFKIKPDDIYSYTYLVKFTGEANGSVPNGDLVVDTNTHTLYGTTYGGGTLDLGLLFKYELAPPDTVDTTDTTGNVGIDPVRSNPANEFYLYPNPSNGSFSIKMQDGKPAEGLVKIYNDLGTKVKELTINEQTTQMQSNLPDGVYFFQIITAKGTSNQRILITH